MITFRIVDTTEVGRFHSWHAGFSSANDAIFPRTAPAFAELVMDRQVWCAIDEADEILGMSYAHISPELDEIEIGGLMVAVRTQGKGIGDVLMRLSLAHLLANEQPLSWEPRPKIVAHVLKSNAKPRGIIDRMGFVHSHAVEIPADRLPGLRAEDDGFVRGDEYHLEVPDALAGLVDWLDSWPDALRDGTPAMIVMLENETPSDWAASIATMR